MLLDISQIYIHQDTGNKVIALAISTHGIIYNTRPKGGVDVGIAYI